MQLKRAKTLCAKRMQYLGGSEYSCYVDSNEVPLEKKVCILFICFTVCLCVCLLGTEGTETVQVTPLRRTLGSSP